MYKVIEEECISCEACITECPTGAIDMRDDIAYIDQDKCEQCGDCVDSCPSGAIIEE